MQSVVLEKEHTERTYIKFGESVSFVTEGGVEDFKVSANRDGDSVTFNIHSPYCDWHVSSNLGIILGDHVVIIPEECGVCIHNSNGYSVVRN